MLMCCEPRSAGKLTSAKGGVTQGLLSYHALSATQTPQAASHITHTVSRPEGDEYNHA